MKLSLPRACIAAFILFLNVTAGAHVEWSRVNDTSPEIVALYHFDSETENPGEILEVPDCLVPTRGLVIGAPVGAGMTKVHDTVDEIFDPHSLRLLSAQSAESTDTIPHVDGDMTVECWFKWDSSMTSSSLEVGMRSAAKIRLTRSLVNPALDQFGISATHGDYLPAGGFTNWVDVGPEEGPLDEWIHVALAVHSTGMHLDVGLNHEIYNAGSIARFYLNGHLAGTPTDITGMRAHPESKILIRNLTGTVFIDELTIWNRDWSDNGVNTFPFADGRGDGTGCNSVRDWTQYE